MFFASELEIFIYELVVFLTIFGIVLGIVFRFALKWKHGLALAFGFLILSAITTFMSSLNGQQANALNFVSGFLSAIQKTLGLFVVNCESADVTAFANVVKGVPFVYEFFHCYAHVLFVVCPLLTFSAVLFVFKRMFSAVRFMFSNTRKTFIFSDLNESSLLLAQDLKSNDKSRCVVFCDVYLNGEERNHELMESAKALGAFCVSNDVCAHGLKFGKKDSVYFFIMGENEEENVNQSSFIIEKYADRENTHLYLFSESKQSEFLIASATCKKLVVRRINETKAVINNHLYLNGNKIFNSAKQVKGEKLISAMVVGLGKFGSRMLKTLAWYCQMTGYKLKLVAIDQDTLALSRLKKECPDLLNPKYNGKTIKGDAYYDISIKSGIDVDSVEFVDEIKKYEATYVFVDLGNDEKNVSVSANLRTLFLQSGQKPIIETVVQNDRTYRQLTTKRVIDGKEYGLCNFKKQEYDLSFIGNKSSVYSEQVVINSELECAGLERHLLYTPKPKSLTKPYSELTDQEKQEISAYKDAINDFYRYEYNYDSSIASAMHIKARQECDVPGARKKREIRTAQERETLNRIEHNRWNAYMRSIGYVWSGSFDKSSRCDIALMHHDLVPFDNLTESEKDKDDV